jgi:hypothetical protein
VHWCTEISFLWYNAVGCLVAVGVGLLGSMLQRDRAAARPAA